MRQIRHLLRAKRLLQNPPSPTRIKLVGAVILAGLAIAGIEAWIGWPDWATIDPGQRGPLR